MCQAIYLTLLANTIKDIQYYSNYIKVIQKRYESLLQTIRIEMPTFPDYFAEETETEPETIDIEFEYV